MHGRRNIEDIVHEIQSQAVHMFMYLGLLMCNIYGEKHETFIYKARIQFQCYLTKI